MSATAEVRSAEVDSNNGLDETVAHASKDTPESRAEGPMGNPDMRHVNAASQAQGRYAFGSGARPLDGYIIKRAIGRGGFGEVYYATSDSGKEVALKLILRNLDVERRGVLQCMNLKCPNLLTIFDLKTSDSGDTFVVMEYVAGPSLASVLKQYPSGLPLTEVRHWLKGLVDGVAYLHDHGIVHRDLKPANLFMEEGIVKIGDYGLAKLITPSQGTDHSESIGTCHYMAPEIGSGKYNKPIDVYAIGVIVYEMLTGRVPFDGETVNEVLMKHLTARPNVAMLPQPYQSIVAKALAKDPTQRPMRVYDLLAPDDAPRAPEVRVIGDQKPGAGVGDRDETALRPSHDEVLRIEAEEPVFYIGPDTRPPRILGRGAVGQRLRANWAALRRPQTYQARRSGPVTTAGARANGVVRRATTARAGFDRDPGVIAPLPERPPLPSTRVRIAELAASMLWAAPILALLAVPAAALLGIDPAGQPQQLAYLYAMTLLGTWLTLIPNKVIETRQTDGTTRRLLALAAGLTLGGGSIVLARALRLGLDPQHDYFSRTQNLEIAYFGALYTVMGGWANLTRRERTSRFRLVPMLGTGLLGVCLIPLWPYVRQDGLAISVLIATAVQLVSPWDEAASLYTQYVRASDKQKRKQKFA
jgi:hypothetical protein